MELRVLRYFQMVAREENITKAAELLHVTQPTLSRQLIQLEDELGTKLFERKNHSITLTEDGMLLKKRSQDILELADQLDREFADRQGGVITGNIVIGSGETNNFNDLARVIEKFKRNNPMVQFEIYTANADDIKERLEKGLADIGILTEPVDISKYNFIRLNKKEKWGILIKDNSPIANKDYVTPKDLIDIPIIMVKRDMVKNEIENWFGGYYKQLNIVATYNLLNNASVLAQNNVGSVMCFDIGTTYDNLKFIPLEPSIETGCVLVWRKNQILSPAVSEFINCFKKYIENVEMIQK